ncbi:MAG: UDP-N-acetylmuramoyl-tripeptide--D-alanyl-D-alanine ligase [Patescibacteria group bacterium]
MRKILQFILKILAKMTLWRYQPVVVAVTGSVGKTSTKEAIYYTLRKRFRVRRNIKNYNNEIGVPLTILGQDIAPAANLFGFFGWLWIILKGLANFIWSYRYPEILVLEMGARQPGDMDYLMSFVPVKIGVLTAIGEFPVHLEFFPEKDKLIQEKATLVKSLIKDGWAILNYDDLSVRMVGDDLPEKTKIINYGFGQGADLKIANYELKINDLEKRDLGVSFKLDFKGSIVPIKLNRALARQQAYAATAAAAVGLCFGLNLVEISNALRKFRTLAGRTRLIKGIKNTWIIDDSYNASPLATIAALETLGEFPGRKIAVLGDMLELGNQTEIAHQQVGQKAAQVADLLFLVGERIIFTAQAAEQEGLSQDKIFKFAQSEQAGLSLQEKLEPGDIILVKGSRSLAMEKVIKEIMAFPEKAGRLLISAN